MHSFTKRAITVLFPLAMIAAPASMLLPVEPVEIENRRLSPPEISVDRLTELAFYLETMNYVSTANPLRTILIRVGAGLDYWVFDDSPDPTRVLKGTGAWLYYRPTIEEACLFPPGVVGRNVFDFVTLLEEDVPTVVFTVAPSKFVIHPEHLNADQTRFAECARASGKQLREVLATASIEHYVDGWEIFEAQKADGVQPYFLTDTHFNFEGSIPWMKALIDEIAPVWDPDDVRDLGQTNWLGNLMRFIGLEEPENVTHLVVDRALEDELVESTPDVRHYRHTSMVTPLVRGSALVIGDSFMELPEPSLVQYFEEVTVVDWRDHEGVEYFMSHAKSSDVVIIEISELDIWRLFADRKHVDDYQSR